MSKIIATVAGASAIAAIAGCTSASVSKSGTAAPMQQHSHSSGPSSASTTGPVGTTFTINDTDSNGSPIAYKVTLLKFSQDATPDNSFDTAPAGDHLAGGEFEITGVKGTSQDDADNDASVTGNNDQTYQTGFEGLAAGTNFDSGNFSVSPGQTQVGWVAFEVRNGITVTSVKWNPDSGLSGSTASWSV
jgi:hypothetical protein